MICTPYYIIIQTKTVPENETVFHFTYSKQTEEAKVTGIYAVVYGFIPWAAKVFFHTTQRTAAIAGKTEYMANRLAYPM